MNKVLVVLLAVCAISVHGFVKRQVPMPINMEDMAAKLQNMGNIMQNGFADAFKDMNDKPRINRLLTGMADDIKALDGLPKPRQ